MKSTFVSDIREVAEWDSFVTRLGSPRVSVVTVTGNGTGEVADAIQRFLHKLPAFTAYLCAKDVREDTPVQRRRPLWNSQSISAALGDHRLEAVSVDRDVCVTGIARLDAALELREATAWAANSHAALAMLPASASSEAVLDALSWVPAPQWVGYWPRLADSVVEMRGVLVRTWDEHGEAGADLFAHPDAYAVLERSAN